VTEYCFCQTFFPGDHDNSGTIAFSSIDSLQEQLEHVPWQPRGVQGHGSRSQVMSSVTLNDL